MSPGDRARNQIDYVTINERSRNSVTRAREFPDADCSSGHVPLVVDIRVHLNRPKKSQVVPKINVKALRKDDNLKDKYNVSVRNKYEALMEETEEDSIENDWQNLRKAIEESNREMLPKTTRMAKRPWMTDAILLQMDERRECKGRNQQQYNSLNRTIHR